MEINEFNKKYKKAGWSLVWKKPEVKDVTPKKKKGDNKKTVKQIREATDNQKFSDFPAVLLFKRVSYRVYPGGQKIGLYQNDKYGVTIPITMTGNSSKLPSLAAATNTKVNELYNALNPENQAVMLELLESEEGLEILDKFIKETMMIDEGNKKVEKKPRKKPNWRLDRFKQDDESEEEDKSLSYRMARSKGEVGRPGSLSYNQWKKNKE